MKEEEEGDGGTLPYRLSSAQHTTLELDQLNLQQPAAAVTPMSVLLLQLQKP